MRDVRIRPRAQLDIESTFVYIALELGQPQAAQGIVDALYEAFERLAAMPEIGRAFEHGDLEQSYRRMLVRNYWIYYTFDKASLVVWRVFHTRQDVVDSTVIDL